MQAFTRESRRQHSLDRKRYAHLASEWLATDGREETVANSEALASYAVAIIATPPAKRTSAEIGFLRQLEATA
jgi:hypothetical protein